MWAQIAPSLYCVGCRLTAQELEFDSQRGQHSILNGLVSTRDLSCKNKGGTGVKLSTHLSLVPANYSNMWRFTSTSPYAFMASCFNLAQGQLVPFWALFIAECSIGLFWSFHRVTCVYLACKVEEFNISIQQFVANIKGDREKASDIILNDELLLMQQLNFHLTIHNPYRPVMGLLIDIKVRVLVQQGNCRSGRERENIKNQNFHRVISLCDTCHLSLPISTALCISAEWTSLIQ